MNRGLRILALRLRSLWRGADLDRQLDEELRYHVERQTEANIASGMSADEARRLALRAIGGGEQRKEQMRKGCLDRKSRARHRWANDPSAHCARTESLLDRGNRPSPILRA